jgi:hypothetical protein
LIKQIAMAATSNLSDILSQVENLDGQGQAAVLERLAMLLRKKGLTASKAVRLTSLSGLGSDIWSKVDIDKYIDGERQW